MTKSTGVGRGGRRPGAGRPRVHPAEVARPVHAPLAELTEDAVRKLARERAATAIAVLADIAANGVKESARVAAAVHILTFAYGKPGSIQSGKKEAAAAAAREAAGPADDGWDDDLNTAVAN